MRDDYSQEEFLQMRENAISHFHKLLRNGQKISAIKIIFNITNMPLRVAKNQVEQTAAKLYYDEREKLLTRYLKDLDELGPLLGSMHSADREEYAKENTLFEHEIFALAANLKAEYNHPKADFEG